MSPKRSAILALLLMLPVPALGVLIAMVFEPTRGTPLGQWIYAVAKIWILALPVLWFLFVEKGRFSLSPMRHGGIGVGIVSGILIAGAIVGGFFLFGHLVDVEQMREAAVRNGIGTPVRFLALVIPLALINSLLEEYVWRWFVFRKCETLIGSVPAIIVSSLLFGLHHLVAVKAQAGWDVAMLATLGVFIGGCIWGWCYWRYQSIWPGYISHIIADLAVFGCGWMILFGRSS